MKEINSQFEKNFFLEIKLVHKDKLFLLGLFLKLIFVFFSYPLIHDLFLPFLKSSILNFSLDPWTTFLRANGDINSFPYGIAMLLAYLPFSTVGDFIDSQIIDLNLFEIGFKFSSLVIDYFLLSILLILTKYNSKRLLITCYWLSPIIFYTTYVHGQIDILPITLLIACILSMTNKRYGLSGFLIALAISSKLSMLVALPFILIFIQRRIGFSREFINFLIIFLISFLILTASYLFSEGYISMVISSREIQRIYSVSIQYGNSFKLYILPIVYLLSLYLIWRLKRINQDLFVIGTGLGFFSILIFLPPAPGWSIWIIPFLVYYQIKSKADIFTIGIIYNSLILLNMIFSASGSYFYFLNNSYNFDFSSISKPILFSDLLFTAQQGFSFLLAIRIYIYGLRKNDFYSLTSSPLIISINGNDKNRIRTFINSIHELVSSRNLNIIKTSDFLFKDKINLLRNSFNKNSFSNNIKDNYFSYYNDHLSNGLNLLNKIIANNNKDYLLVDNDFNLRNLSFNEKIDLFVNINMASKIDSFFLSDDSLNQKKDVNFDFQKITKDNFTNKNIYSLTTYLPLGVLHTELIRYLIAISSLHVDSDVSEDKDWVKLTIEGNPSSEDIFLIAKNLIINIDDYPLNNNSFSGGYEGIMQIVLLARISNFFENKMKK